MLRKATSVTTLWLSISILFVCRCAFPEDTRPTLRGLTAIEIQVEPVPKIPGLRITEDQIRSDVESRFSRLGIKVVADAIGIPGTPVLYVRLSVARSTSAPLYTVETEVSLRQSVRLTRNPSIKPFLASTWSTGSVSSIAGENNLNTVRDTLGHDLTDFVKAYRSVNRNLLKGKKTSSRP